MADCLFTSRGQTRAQLMMSALEHVGIRASLRKLPLKLANEGCAYGVAVTENDRERALKTLRLEGLPPRRVYCERGYEWMEVGR